MATSQAGQLAGLALDYLIGADGPQRGDGNRITETPIGVKPAALGPSIAYCNLRREDGEPAEYGPYLPHDDIFRQYGEGRPDPKGKGFRRNLVQQLDRCKRLGHTLVEQDNPDSYPLSAVMLGIALAQERGLGIIAKNPKLLGSGAAEYVGHPNVFGIIVEDGCGNADELDGIRRRAGKGDLPVWFVFFGDGRSAALARKNEIIARGYGNMGVTYSATGEYGSSEDVLLPRIASPHTAPSNVNTAPINLNRGSTMVWKGDGSKRLAKSLITLIDQVDAQFPIRDRSSDGTIGDASHQAGTSDHNPDREGVVRALDISHDPARGFDSYRFAENLRLGRDPRIKYVISNRKIFGDDGYAERNGAKAWMWGAYHGASPHDMHVHVSVSAKDALADDTRPWVYGDIVSAERPRLKPGDTGDAVKEAQKLLNVAVTGTFDAATEEALRAFQARTIGLEVDGLIGPYTWRALLADHPPETAAKPVELSPDLIKIIAMLAASSPIARYSWQNRGVAPAGYIKGMAVTFAQVCQKWKAGDSAAHVMAMPNSGNDNVDALSWFDSNFRGLGMSNARGGLDTLRHLFVLLIGLGMRESSGKCFEGRDMSASNTTGENAEAGLFQQSHNSFSASPELGKLMEAYQANPSWGFQGIFREGVAGGPSPNLGDGAGAAFQRLCKLSPSFAVEAAAVGLRTNRSHWGPINRKEVELRPEADALLAQVQQIVEAASAPVPTPSPVPTPPPRQLRPLYLRQPPHPPRRLPRRLHPRLSHHLSLYRHHRRLRRQPPHRRPGPIRSRYCSRNSLPCSRSGCPPRPRQHPRRLRRPHPIRLPYCSRCWRFLPLRAPCLRPLQHPHRPRRQRPIRPPCCSRRWRFLQPLVPDGRPRLRRRRSRPRRRRPSRQSNFAKRSTPSPPPRLPSRATRQSR